MCGNILVVGRESSYLFQRIILIQRYNAVLLDQGFSNENCPDIEHQSFNIFHINFFLLSETHSFIHSFIHLFAQ